MADPVLKVFHHFDAPAETVFDAWLDPKIAGRFLFATETGRMETVEIDARVGGRFLFIDVRPDAGPVAHEGEYLEIDRPRHLAFTFAVPKYDPGYTTVTLDIAPAAGGGCDLTLTHEGVPEEWRAPSIQGWTMILGKMAGVLAG